MRILQPNIDEESSTYKAASVLISSDKHALVTRILSLPVWQLDIAVGALEIWSWQKIDGTMWIDIFNRIDYYLTPYSQPNSVWSTEVSSQITHLLIGLEKILVDSLATDFNCWEHIQAIFCRVEVDQLIAYHCIRVLRLHPVLGRSRRSAVSRAIAVQPVNALATSALNINPRNRANDPTASLVTSEEAMKLAAQSYVDGFELIDRSATMASCVCSYSVLDPGPVVLTFITKDNQLVSRSITTEKLVNQDLTYLLSQSMGDADESEVPKLRQRLRLAKAMIDPDNRRIAVALRLSSLEYLVHNSPGSLQLHSSSYPSFCTQLV